VAAEPAPRAVYVGTAAWTIPAPHAARFPAAGSHLERYSAVLPAVEINTSFYRDHRPATYERWGASVPPAFRFAVKVPKRLTHEARLGSAPPEIHAFLDGPLRLGDRLGVLLVQLPPSLVYDAGAARRFFGVIRARWPGGLVCEPRHPSWFTAEAERFFEDLRIGRVAADPAPVPEAADPGGWTATVYYRLHGSPRMYYSPYDPAALDSWADRLRGWHGRSEVWCVFDNTAEFHATHDALEMYARLRR
jgi:uncharacterized protein YecE (DUF72 family)